MKVKQSGIALVAVLLVVAIATIMVVTITREQQVSIHLTRGFLSRGQAGQYALGGEELARQILQEDHADGADRDHLFELWASPNLHFEFEDGEVDLRITDLQGFLNVNSLSSENKAIRVSRQRVINLLLFIGVDPLVADRIHDWIDKDTSSRPGGLEDFDYLVFDLPYRAGNSVMQDISELNLMGLESDTLQLISPFFSALPDPSASINVNTAPSSVLQALSPELSPGSAASLTQRREAQATGFDSVTTFLQLPEFAGIKVATDGLGVQSSFFEVRAIARYQERFSYLTSILHRNLTDGTIRVIYRDFSKKFRPQNATLEDSDD